MNDFQVDHLDDWSWWNVWCSWWRHEETKHEPSQLVREMERVSW
jgi:hypothetical protein